MGAFIHAANVLYLVSYLVRDILWLRCLTVVAICTLMPYFYFQDTPLWAAIGWNVLFAGINLFQIYKLLLARRPLILSVVEQELYKLGFASLTPRQFRRLFEAGELREIQAGQEVITRGQKLTELMVVFRGGLDVRVEDASVAALGPGRLVGEISYATGREPSADVRAVADSCVLVWPHEKLDRVLQADGELRAGWQRLIIGDLTGKLALRGRK